MQYRAEIDGLRAVAVVPVILYHAGFAAFGGGFVGVDVFFVISGYLITSLLLADLETGRFSLAAFYERRARRILPALFFVMAVSLPFAWLWLMPGDMQAFAQSVAAVATFSSNILFWQQSGYFDPAAELKPLLHTWSLAVEEQYYVLFPLFLLLTWRLGRRRVALGLLGITLGSLGLAHWAAEHRPAAAFYLLPTRGWEILLGALAAFYLRNGSPPLPPRIRAALGIAGLSLIAFAIAVFDEGTPFPGLPALVPTAGTVLVILGAGPGNLAGELLGHRVFTGIGLISYSAYLWHQPLLAFARYQSPGEPPPALLALLCALTLPLAYLTWRFVEKPFREKPFRRGTGIDRRTVFAGAATASISFLLLGAWGHAADGFASRLTDAQREVLAWRDYPRAEAYREGACFLRPEQEFTAFAPECLPSGGGGMLMWGDSHAAALAAGLRMSRADLGQLTASGCPPLLGEPIPARPFCATINEHVLAVIEQTRPETVVLHAAWIYYRNRLPALAETIDRIRMVSPTTRISVVGGVPQWSPDLPTTLVRRGVGLEETHVEKRLAAERLGEVLAADAALESIIGGTAAFLQPARHLCAEDGCRTLLLHGNKVVPYAWDSAHLTEAGAGDLATALFPLAATRP